MRRRVLYRILHGEAIHESFSIVPGGEQPNDSKARASFSQFWPKVTKVGIDLITLCARVSRCLFKMLHDSV